MATLLKTKRTAPKVFYAPSVMKTLSLNYKANEHAIHTIGAIIMKLTDNSGFTSNDGEIFAHYNKLENTLIVSLHSEMLTVQ